MSRVEALRLNRVASATSVTGASPIVIWAFYLFVASLPFEYPNRVIPIETTTLTGAIFLFTTLLQPLVCYRRPPAAFWLVSIYLYAIVLSFVVTGGDYPGDTLKALLQRALVLIIFVAAFNLLRDPRVARTALIILGLAAVVLALMTVSGVVGLEGMGRTRLTMFGQNPNRAARILSGGLLALVGLAYGGARPPLRPKPLVWAGAALIGAAVLDTGSRGGILALAIGLFAVTLGGQGVGVRTRNAIVAVLGLAAITWAALNSPAMRRRIELAQRGDLAGREQIFPLAWGMFLEKPLVGWGTGENNYELARRISDGVHLSRDTHNLVLEVLTSTGLVGTVPFLLGLGLCLLAAWRARAGPLGIVPFAMLMALLAGNMAGNYVVLKLMWFVLALCAASPHAAAAPAPVPAPPPRPRHWRAGVLPHSPVRRP